MARAISSGKLTPSAGAVISTHEGAISLVSIIAAAVDATLTLHDCATVGDIAIGNEIVSFSVDVSLNGIQGGGNITTPIEYTNGLCYVLTGAGAAAYVGYIGTDN